MMALSALGNVHTTTMRAFDAAEFAAIVEKAPKMKPSWSDMAVVIGDKGRILPK